MICIFFYALLRIAQAIHLCHCDCSKILTMCASNLVEELAIELGLIRTSDPDKHNTKSKGSDR